MRILLRADVPAVVVVVAAVIPAVSAVTCSSGRRRAHCRCTVAPGVIAVTEAWIARDGATRRTCDRASYYRV